MTIADYKMMYKKYLLRNERTLININKLMHGEILCRDELNSILVYYGFNGESPICIGSMCHNCKFNVKNKPCNEVSSDYVRKLIEDRMNLRIRFEDLL